MPKNEWVNYIFVIKPDTNRYSVTGYFYGDGVGRQAAKRRLSLRRAGTGKQCQNRYGAARRPYSAQRKHDEREGNIAYIDDIKIYSAGSFSIRMPETENINTIAGITVKANHDIDMTTVNSGSVALKKMLPVRL